MGGLVLYFWCWHMIQWCLDLIDEFVFLHPRNFPFSLSDLSDRSLRRPAALTFYPCGGPGLVLATAKPAEAAMQVRLCVELGLSWCFTTAPFSFRVKHLPQKIHIAVVHLQACARCVRCHREPWIHFYFGHVCWGDLKAKLWSTAESSEIASEGRPTVTELTNLGTCCAFSHALAMLSGGLWGCDASWFWPKGGVDGMLASR